MLLLLVVVLLLLVLLFCKFEDAESFDSLCWRSDWWVVVEVDDEWWEKVISFEAEFEFDISIFPNDMFKSSWDCGCECDCDEDVVTFSEWISMELDDSGVKFKFCSIPIGVLLVLFCDWLDLDGGFFGWGSDVLVFERRAAQDIPELDVDVLVVVVVGCDVLTLALI